MKHPIKTVEALYPATKPLLVMKALIKSLPTIDGKFHGTDIIRESNNPVFRKFWYAILETVLQGRKIEVIVEAFVGADVDWGRLDAPLNFGNWVRLRTVGEGTGKDQAAIEAFATKTGAIYRKGHSWEKDEKHWHFSAVSYPEPGFDHHRRELLSILGIYNYQAVHRLLTETGAYEKLRKYVTDHPTV